LILTQVNLRRDQNKSSLLLKRFYPIINNYSYLQDLKNKDMKDYIKNDKLGWLGLRRNGEFTI
jgi:hypothetical protein